MILVAINIGQPKLSQISVGHLFVSGDLLLRKFDLGPSIVNCINLIIATWEGTSDKLGFGKTASNFLGVDRDYFPGLSETRSVGKDLSVMRFAC